MDLRVGIHNAREIHHLAETHDPVPGHHLADFFRTDVRTRILKARYSRHAGRDVRHGLERRPLRVVYHCFYSFRSAYIADLVRVHEYAGGAVRHYGPCVFTDAYHRGFDMDMGIHEARSDVMTAGIDDLRVVADAVQRIADKRDPAAGDRDIDALLDLAGAYVHQLCVPDDRVGFFNAHGYIGQFPCKLI